MPRVGALAADDLRMRARRDQLGRVSGAARGRAHGEFERRQCGDGVAAASRDISGPWRPLERAHALANRSKILAVDRKLRLARYKHEADLARPGLGGEVLAGLQAVKGEAHVAPAGALRRHLGNEAMGALRPHAQFRHSLLLNLAAFTQLNTR